MYSLSAGFFIVNIKLYIGCCSELKKIATEEIFLGLIWERADRWLDEEATERAGHASVDHLLKFGGDKPVIADEDLVAALP